MKVTKTRLPGVLLLEPQAFGDARGYFMESYNRNVFSAAGLRLDLLQDNQSLSAEAGTLRGLHYQLDPMAQNKVVRTLYGAIYDVVVDIRRKSPTFGQWLGFILTADNKRQVVAPRGFAHAVCTLVPNTLILYKVDNLYSPEHERGILWSDPKLAIDWPVTKPILSEKDQHWPTFDKLETNFTYEEQPS